MKCLILAGGRGERLWPLSRKNFPKQFIQVQKNHSLFQEAVARNLPYCDEFIIITNREYRDIISNQMGAFQGVPYQCQFEEAPRKTTAAIALACLNLQPSEYVFVVAADHLIGTGDCPNSYRECILRAREEARQGHVVLFGRKTADIDSRFGYMAGDVFYEKPDRRTARALKGETIHQNIGLMLFQNGTFLNELRRLQGDIFRQCVSAYEKRKRIAEGVLYPAEALGLIEPVAIEKSVIERTDRLRLIEIGFPWSDVGSLEDLEKTDFVAEGISIAHESANCVIMNQAPRQTVVVNDLDNVLVVNTSDAVYVGRRGKSHLLKEILHDNPEMEASSERGMLTYRPWGYYEQIAEEERYRVRRVIILPGKTIYEHRHEERQESWTLIEGVARVTLDGESRTCSGAGVIEVRTGVRHQISNIGDKNLVLIETAVGDVLHGGDILSCGDARLTEAELGLQIDPMIKLLPAFKDYLWGGEKLRNTFGKKCDYDIIAESWELSAHPAGNSIVATGRHKGMSLSQYLDAVGSSVLGWKCMQGFPLLIKFIDASKNLSVQVHPNDDYALEHEDEYGKNEMWYVVDAEPGAGLYVGFNRDVSRQEVERRVRDNTILDILNFFPTKPGDVFFIPAGTVHAIGAGNLICEIQQNSNCTYRLYDYDRRDRFGNPRELHLDKALDVMDYSRYQPAELEARDGKIRCKYFEVETMDVNGVRSVLLSDDSFHSVICIRGEGKLALEKSELSIRAGESVFIPAINGELRIEGRLSVVVTRI